MYCVHCGAEGAATYCGKCGKLQKPSQTASSSRTDDSIVPASEVIDPTDWVTSLDYHRLLEFKEPRQRIVAASKKCRPGVTGEDVLAILEAVAISKVSLTKLTHAIVPIMDKLGFRTTNQSQSVWRVEAGRILLAYLCSLASKSLEVTDVEQKEDSCVLSAKIPLGIFTNPGKVITTLETNSGWVRVTLAATISGQWHDWGKSKRLIEDILAGINADLIDQSAGQAVPWQRVA